ncbi:MAG: UDP-N-acetylmuramoyl-L-alanyl-D-glutamate--2,6-diaminopimelate ligase [bacterium]
MHSFKKKIPDYIKIPGHFLRSHVAALIYQFPAKKMIIVGVTGTKGKTSTANFVWSVLHAGGYKTGLISTAIFRFGSDEEINPYHMTMPDAFIIQKNLKRMQEKGIEIVVIEMTSEGMKQYRHAGIPIDIAIFTNLSPEHLPSHKNNFELYKKAKAKLFQALSKKPKKLRGISVPRSIIANSDNDHAKYYLQFEADKKITYGIDSGDIRATEIKNETIGVSFTAINETFKISIFGAFNIYNALPALIVGTLVHIPTENIRKGLVSLAVIPGRMEEINEGQDFTLFVDYAHEPVSIGAVLSAAEEMKRENSKIIILFGAEGGGRDTRKRMPMAELSAQRADYVIVTDVDPYDDNPQTIIDDVATMVELAGKTPNKNLFAILDRKEAIEKALSLAKKDDIVLITGKGAEQSMITNHGAIPWNEREIVRTLLKNKLKN